MKQTVVLFDGVCNLCNSSVQFLLKWDKKKQFKFASLQSVFGQKLMKDNHMDNLNLSSILFLENDVIYQKSNAVLRLSRYLSFPLNTSYFLLIVPKFIRDFFYDIVAKYRYNWFGKREECILPNPELKDRFIP